MSAGRIALLLVHGANPAHSLPAAFSQALGHVDYRVSFSSYLDETAAASDLILPDVHPLEQWNDSRPRAGVYALQQPVMQPVFPNARHTGDVLLQVSGSASSFKEYLQTRWRPRPGIRRLLERRRAARRRVRRRAGAERAARSRNRAAAGRPGRRGRRVGAAPADRLPVDRAPRRPRRQQAVVAGAPRPG